MHQHTCRVGTARIDYRGEKHQIVLNTTVKSGSGLGKVFAPTWEMVMAFKRSDIDWQTYTVRYQAMMRERYRQNPAAFLEALSCDELIVCCYCKDMHATTQHCHRYLLVDVFEKVAHHHGVRLERIGEVRNSRSLSGCFYFSTRPYRIYGGGNHESDQHPYRRKL